MKKEYESEEEFLKEYDDSKYEKPSVTSDIVLFSVSDEKQTNYRKLKKKHYSVLLVKRNTYPFKGKWCLPGGFINNNETSEQAARRILAQETNLHNIFMEQLYTFDSLDRDPRTRVMSITYMGLVDKNKLNDSLYENASWFNITSIEDEKHYYVTLDNGNEQIKYVIRKVLKESTTDRYYFEIEDGGNLAFDNPRAITAGMARLKQKIKYTDIVFNMMGDYFTLGELQQVYEIIIGKKLLDPAFRRMIADKVEKTDKIKTGEGHRPSVLFKYKNKSGE